MFSGLSIGDLGILIVSILLAMSFHEATHAFVGHALGDTTAKDQGRLTLNPLKHINLLTTVLLPIGMILLGLPPIFAAQPVPFNPDRVKYDEFGAAMIAVAGPVSNLVLAFVAALILRAIPASQTTLFHFFVIFISVNVGLFVFNMIPFPPLDGSRVLYAVAPEPVQKVMAVIEGYGFMAILVFIIVIFPLLGPVISNINESIYHFLLSF